ncbi:hypothetical protein BURKHO8Y_270023 [Burkholderia sp. 8Y]|nr:hypothetical protein BURKHO8Y_270023 [Burkholderia sp. 8Y]
MSVAALGWTRGPAEATAMVVRKFTGAVSDWLGRSKALLPRGRGATLCATRSHTHRVVLTDPGPGRRTADGRKVQLETEMRSA